MTNDEAIQWCAEHGVKVVFHDPEKKRQEAGLVTITHIGNEITTLGQGATLIDAVEDAARIDASSPERIALGRVAWEAHYHATMARYDDEEAWRCVGDAVAERVLELQRIAVEASE